MELEWLHDNVARRVRRPREPRGRVRFLSDLERQRLLAACQESTDRRLHSLALLALSTGARQGELLRLRWPDLDLQRRLAVVHHTKNGDRKALPLVDTTIAAIRQLAKARRHLPMSSLVAWRCSPASSGLVPGPTEKGFLTREDRRFSSW